MGGTSTPSMNTTSQPLGDAVGAIGAMTQGAINGVRETVTKQGQMGGRMFRFMSRRKQRKMMRKSRKSHKKKTHRRR
jgi:hypothetical protein